MTLAPPEVRRTDIACKNCGDAVADHVSINFPLQGCRACMKEHRNPICDWVYDEKTGSTIPPSQAKKLSLGDFI